MLRNIYFAYNTLLQIKLLLLLFFFFLLTVYIVRSSVFLKEKEIKLIKNNHTSKVVL